MQVRSAVLLSFGWLFCLSMTGASCSGGQSESVLGYIELDGRTAVYAPICGDNEVAGVRVYRAPDPGEDGDFLLIWQVANPISQSAKDGLVILGDSGDFTTVVQDAPAQFPSSLSVAFDMAKGDIIAQARLRPADLPRYASGTPVTEMTFDTPTGRVSYQDLIRSAGRAGECA